MIPEIRKEFCNIVAAMFRRLIRQILIWLGIFSLLMMVLACTRIPFDLHRWLGTKVSAFHFSPAVIVMFGGSGMPSESNLIRLYYVKELALIYPRAQVLLAHPNDSGTVYEMKAFLVAFGIDSLRISALYEGNNTREQAMLLSRHYAGIENEKIAVVTSPEHMYRTVKTLRKLNFKNVGGVAAFENPLFINLGYDYRKIGGKKYVPDVSGNLSLRYNFWNYLKLEIICFREYFAIAYYKINGWI